MVEMRSYSRLSRSLELLVALDEVVREPEVHAGLVVVHLFEGREESLRFRVTARPVPW